MNVHLFTQVRVPSPSYYLIYFTDHVHHHLCLSTANAAKKARSASASTDQLDNLVLC